ncbi:hypothetical protein F0562_007855 [Nyssa sinensis]|uniref:Protein FATTY ACID EXPORT 4, chloroplastic n=1 Tax=Nyssa sinensis TaxID=561372 RepID=A0A5J5A4L5_9ASTE|nr:hypothetical protein F0562_007855 [Nyssa sinensis]
MTGCCAFLIPAAVTGQSFKFPQLGRGNDGRRRRLSGISFAFAAPSSSTKFRERRRSFNGKSNSTNNRFRCNSQLVADLAPATSAAYGVLLFGGGLFAFTRSGSKGSLLGGLTGAALMATAYFLMQAPETKAIGESLGFGSALLFAFVFGIRLSATRKITPAGPLLGLSICALAVFISAYLQDSL